MSSMSDDHVRNWERNAGPPSYPPVSNRVLGIYVPLRLWPRWWKRGCTRECFLIGRWAVKVPTLYGRWRNFIQGIDANLQEAEFRVWDWPEVCPVLWSFMGLVNVYPRCEPLSPEQWEGFSFVHHVTRGDHYAMENLIAWGGDARRGREPEALVVPAENKIASFGVLDGRIVCIDYGN